MAALSRFASLGWTERNTLNPQKLSAKRNKWFLLCSTIFYLFGKFFNLNRRLMPKNCLTQFLSLHAKSPSSPINSIKINAFCWKSYRTRAINVKLLNLIMCRYFSWNTFIIFYNWSALHTGLFLSKICIICQFWNAYVAKYTKLSDFASNVKHVGNN